MVLISVAALGCGGKKKEEGADDKSIVKVGKLVTRELKSPNGKTTVKGTLPEKWTEKAALNQVAARVEQSDKASGASIAHVEVGPSLLATKPPKEMSSDVASTEAS